MTITRANITTREVTSRMLDNHIGYIALHGFSNPSSTQFHDAIAELLDDGATSFVFDLRDNPGGYIDAANKIASEFIKSGLVFTQESAADGVKRWEATGDGLATDPKIPVVVLVNNGSASASEIVRRRSRSAGGRRSSASTPTARTPSSSGIRWTTAAACGSRSPAGSPPITTASRRTACSRTSWSRSPTERRRTRTCSWSGPCEFLTDRAWARMAASPGLLTRTQPRRPGPHHLAGLLRPLRPGGGSVLTARHCAASPWAASIRPTKGGGVQ